MNIFVDCWCLFISCLGDISSWIYAEPARIARRQNYEKLCFHFTILNESFVNWPSFTASDSSNEGDNDINVLNFVIINDKRRRQRNCIKEIPKHFSMKITNLRWPLPLHRSLLSVVSDQHIKFLRSGILTVVRTMICHLVPLSSLRLILKLLNPYIWGCWENSWICRYSRKGDSRSPQVSSWWLRQN